MRLANLGPTSTKYSLKALTIVFGSYQLHVLSNIRVFHQQTLLNPVL